MNAASYRANRYADVCARCRNQVPAGAGTLQGPPWKTICPGCLPVPAATAVANNLIHVRYAGTAIAFHAAGFLGDRFGAYRAALDGCRWNRTAKLNLADDAQFAGRVVARLQAAGFLCKLDDDVAAAINAATAVATTERTAAEDRAAIVDAALKARGLALYPFQRIGVSWIAPRKAALLGDDMGLGKTIQAQTALPDGAPVVVVSPAVAKGVWARECKRWRPDYTPVVLDGRTAFRWAKPGEMVILNWDILPAVEDPSKTKIKPCRSSHDALVRACPRSPAATNAYQGWDRFLSGIRGVVAALKVDLEMSPTWWKAWLAMWERVGRQHHARDVIATVPAGTVIIADEAHTLKYSKTLRTQRFRALSKVVRERDGRAWLLTATPLLNDPPELWAVLDAAGLAREAFGNWGTFVRIAGGEKTRFGYQWHPAAMDKAALAERLQRVMLRRMKVDVLTELPAKQRRVIEVDLSATAVKLCEAAQAAIAAGASDDDARAELMLAADHALLVAKVAANQSVTFQSWSRARAAIAAAKFEAAIEMIESYEDAGVPLVVFSAHRHPIDTLGVRPGWAAITGDTPPAVRTQIEEAFQRGELKGVAGTIKAAGVAITLTHAYEAFFIDLDPTPALNLQAEDRINRIGQTRGVLITQFVAKHKLDERTHELLVKKMAMIEKSVDAAKRAGDEVPPELAADLDRAAAEIEAAAADARAYVERLAAIAAELAAAEADRKTREAERKNATKVKKSLERRGVAPEGLGGGGGGARDSSESTPRRGPQSDVETWAAEALVQLALMDSDHAFRENSVGFSKADVSIGHYLAGRVGGGMTDDEWRLAPAVCGKYWRQIGPRPGSELAKKMGGAA